MTTMECHLDLSIAEELAAAVERGGGSMVVINGGDIELFLPEGVAHLLPDLKAHKVELLALLHRLGGRVAYFPMCPRCSAYCLYREGSIGLYECHRCGLQGIEEHAARIASFLAESKFAVGRVQ